jgi:hypothetical protein
MVAVLMGANGLGKPFGHPAYHPIYEAAAELGLRVIISAGGDELRESATYPAAGGTIATYAEFRTLAPQALMTHSASIIGQGVMDHYQDLRFLLLGGSAAWITPFLWRLDTEFKAFRHDMLWLKELPSELFKRSFMVGTHPFMFAGEKAQLERYWGVDEELRDVICYASGYPDSECTIPADVSSMFPPGWMSSVLGQNALSFFGWSNESPRVPATEQRTGV